MVKGIIEATIVPYYRSLIVSSVVCIILSISWMLEVGRIQGESHRHFDATKVLSRFQRVRMVPPGLFRIL